MEQNGGKNRGRRECGAGGEREDERGRGEHTLFGRVVVWCQAVVQATRSYNYRTSKFEYFAHILGGPRRLAATTTFEWWGRTERKGKERGACEGPNSLRFPTTSSYRRWPTRSPCRHTLRNASYSNPSTLARPTSNPGPAICCHTRRTPPPPTDAVHTRQGSAPP